MKLHALLPVLAVLAACAAPPEPSSDSGSSEHRPRQIILKLAGAADASQPGALARLSELAGVKLNHVRPMSGGAHVLAAPTDLTDVQFGLVLAKLAAAPNVEYAEPDRIKRHY